MKRHKFIPGFVGLLCGQVIDSTSFCGLLADDPIHQPRYDPYTAFWLRQRPDDYEEESGIPVHAYLCTDCGVVVVDTAVHDRFHDILENR